MMFFEFIFYLFLQKLKNIIMKKTLLSLLFVSMTQISIGQTLITENFSALTVGNIGTDLTGATAGQADYFTFATNGTAPTTTTNMNNSNFQIVVDATNGNSFQITGPNGDKGSKIMWQDGLVDSWATRTTGNDIIEVEFDFNPSVLTTSRNSFRVYLYSDEATAKVLAGMGIAINQVAGTTPNATNVVSGFGYWTSTPGTGTYIFGLGADANTPLTIPSNTWTRMGFSFNKTTGEIKWKGAGLAEGGVSFNGNASFPLVTAGINPGEVDLLAVSGNTTANPNALAHSAKFDNLVVRASATDTLLGVSQVASVNDFTVYPNPASDVISVSSVKSINGVKVVDLNGRIMKQTTYENVSSTSINVSDLASGVYFLNISSDSGSVSKKFMKN